MDIATLISQFGVAGGLLGFALIAGAKGLWVFGWQYQQIIKDRDQWRDIALKGTALAERVVDKATQ